MQSADLKTTQQVQLKLANRGIRNPCAVAVFTKNGEVTLSGTVQYPHQKKSAVQAASGVMGVRRVIDHLIVKPIDRR